MLKALLMLILAVPSVASANDDSASGSIDFSSVPSAESLFSVGQYQTVEFGTSTAWSRDLIFMAGNVEAFRINAENKTFWINPEIKADKAAQKMLDILRGLVEDGGLCRPAPTKKKARRIER